MYGYVIPGHRLVLERRRLGGVWFAVAEIPCCGLLARLGRRRAYRLLRREGITRCVLPEQWAEEAAAYGLLPVEVYSLRQALLPGLLDRQGDLQHASAVLRAPYVSAAVSAAAMLLAQRVRYLSLETGGGTVELADMLRCRYGLCAGRIDAAALTVCFGGAPPPGPAICLGPDCARFQSLTYAPIPGLPQDAPEQLIAALFEVGEIKKEEIYVKTIARNA